MSNQGKRRRPHTAKTAAPASLRSIVAAATVEHPQALPPSRSAPDAVRQSAPVDSSGALNAYLERNAPEVVGVTYWFDPPPSPLVQSFVLRLTGRRTDVSGPPGPRDKFTRDVTCENVVAGSGPIAITVKIRDVNPGEWIVDAKLVADREIAMRRSRSQITKAARTVTIPVHRTRWSWRRWRVQEAPTSAIQTRLAPLVRPPAVILGSWTGLVALGIVLALITQSIVISRLQLQVSRVSTASLLIVLVGIIGAKAWYIFLHRREGRREGWAVQGMVTAFVVAAPLVLAILQMPIGVFLDASAPGIMIGLAVGRLGCFFTGCCAGRTTAARLGVWSSNRTIGARRIPTQLLESALALSTGIVVLSIVLRSGTRSGTLFVGAIAAYTLIRQGILRMREEPRQTRLGDGLVACAAVVALVVEAVVLATM